MGMFLLQAFAISGTNRYIKFSLEPRVLTTGSDSNQTAYSIDEEGHISKIEVPYGLRYHGVDLTSVGDRRGLFFVLTPTEELDIPMQYTQALKQGACVTVELEGIQFEIFALLPTRRAKPNLLAFVGREKNAALIASMSQALDLAGLG